MQNQPNPTGNPGNTSNAGTQGNFSGSIIEPATQGPFAPSAPGMTPMNTGATLTSAADPAVDIPVKKSSSNLLIIIILILVSVIAAVFIGLFIWKSVEYSSLKTDIDGQIDAARNAAVAENTTKMEAEFAEREKYPYKQFTGPADYGSLSFEYPRTWSVYVARDAVGGGDFEAYMNPVEVQPVGARTINALRVEIRNVSFDSVVAEYENLLRSSLVALTTRNVAGILANIYSGELSADIRGVAAVFKLRDKTVILQTDADIFTTEFFKLLDTVTAIQ